MKQRSHSAFYFADDKDVADLLNSSKVRLTNNTLREFLRWRGIIESENASRERLVEYVSTLTLDYHEVEWLLERSSQKPKGAKSTSVSVRTSATFDQLEEALVKVRQTRGESHAEVYSIRRKGENLQVTVEYSEIQHSRNRLRQRRKLSGSLAVSIHPGGTTTHVRHDANKKMKSVAAEFIAALEDVTGGDVEERRIELTQVLSSATRTQFFTNMMAMMPGVGLVDVPWAAVHRSVEAEVTETDCDLFDLEEDDYAEPPSDGSAVPVSPESASVGGMVKELVLRGDELLTSPEYQGLQKDFYLCGAVWDAEELRVDGEKVRFEAVFEDKELCTGFKYNVRMFRRRIRNGGFSSNLRVCTREEKLKYSTLLEEAAVRALAAAERDGIPDLAVEESGTAQGMES